MSFNNGKMEHIFQIDRKTNLYKKEFTNQTAQKAFLNGTRYIKIDGQSGAIWKRKEGDVVLLTRYDDRRNRFKNGIHDGYISLFDGGNPNTYCGHNYYYKIWERPATTAKNKGQPKILRELYSQLDSMKNIDQLLGIRKFMSVEYVGEKFQKTLGILGNKFMIHSEQLVEKSSPLGSAKSFEEVKHAICSNVIEGLVIEYEGIYYKIRQNCFTKNGIFEKESKKWKKLKLANRLSARCAIELLVARLVPLPRALLMTN